MTTQTKRADILALTFTAILVAFVGAIVVLTIPYAIFSAPLPPDLNRLGLPVATPQNLLFGQVWYLLIPSILFAVWIGYKFYQWGLSVALAAAVDETAVDTTDLEP